MMSKFTDHVRMYALKTENIFYTEQRFEKRRP